VNFIAPMILKAAINGDAFVVAHRQAGLTNAQQNGLFFIRSDHPERDLVIDKIDIAMTVGYTLSVVAGADPALSTVWTQGKQGTAVPLRSDGVINRPFSGTVRVSNATAQTVVGGLPIVDFQLAFALSSQEFLGLTSGHILPPTGALAASVVPVGAGVGSVIVHMWYL